MEKDILQLTSKINLRLEFDSMINRILEIEDLSMFQTLLDLSSEISTDCPIESSITLEIRGN